MSLSIKQHEMDGIVILDLNGQLTIGEDDIKLRDTLTAFGHSRKINLVLNLRGVDLIDSSGLGTLVFAQAKLKKLGGRLALSSINPTYLKLFLLTKLALAFEFFPDDHQAVNSFYPDRSIHHFDILEFVRQQEGHGAVR